MNFRTFFFGCSHRRTTFPQRERRSKYQRSSIEHVTCLECGKEFEYDWQQMKRGLEIKTNTMDSPSPARQNAAACVQGAREL